MKKAVLIGAEVNVRNVYPDFLVSEWQKRVCLDSDLVVTRANAEANREKIRDAEILLGTWGVDHFTVDEIRRYFPGVRAFFYSAGTVRDFGAEFLDAGIRLFSAWGANAVPVVEYTVAQIVLAGKSFFQACRLYSGGNHPAAVGAYHSRRGNYGARVGLLGAGMIGSMVAERLSRDYKFEVLCYDPFCSPEKAERIGVRLASLEEIFSTCDVISNHLANKKEIEGIISRDLLFRMKDNATLINTGRGAQLDENGLYDFLVSHPAACAVLDVTWPEPVKEGSPMFALPNLFLTPHIAGSYGDEVWRMTEYMLAEYDRMAAGEPCRWEVTPAMLKTMA